MGSWPDRPGFSSSAIFLTALLAMAKPRPSADEPLPRTTAVFMPITSPCVFSSGPPELRADGRIVLNQVRQR